MIRNLWQDVTYGVRRLHKQSLMSAIIIVMLTMGIGVSTGIFTFINAVFLRARVDQDHDSFVRVFLSYTKYPDPPGQLSKFVTLEDYLAFRDRSKSLRDLAAWADFEAPLGKDDSVEVRALLVTPNFFSLYDMRQPLMGRLLQPEDFASSNRVVVISERLWRNRLSADPQIIGKVIHFNDQPVTVVGVTPSFAGQINNARAWVPYTLETYLKRGEHLLKPGEAAWLAVGGRLNPGFSHQDAASELRLIAGQQDRLHSGRSTLLLVTDGSEINDPGTPPVFTLLVYLMIGAPICLVFIICTNVATLLLARAASRQQDITVRLALGAGKMRLIRMLLTETCMLAAIAGLASLYFAYNLPNALANWTKNDLRDQGIEWSLTPDWRTFGYLMLISLLSGILVGLTPALQSLRVNLSDALKNRQSLLGAAAGGSRLRSLLIGVQMALSFVLLFGAVIFARAYQRMSSVNPGYETRQVLYAILRTSDKNSEKQSWSVFRRDLAERLEALPGVQSVAYASQLPFIPGSKKSTVQVPGQLARQAAQNWVSPNFFSTLGIPLVSGRSLQISDPPCTPGVKSICPVVVSRKLAGEFWPAEDPLGKTFNDLQGTSFEVVGVARDISSQRLGEPDDPMFYPTWDPNAGPNSYQPFIRFSGDGALLSSAATVRIRELAPEISIEMRTIQQWMDQLIESIGNIRMLIAVLGVVAVILAMIGIYGIVSFAVTQRLKELGIRIALGARKKDIYGAVFRAVLRPIVAGLLIGLLLTWGAANALARLLQLTPLPFALNLQDPVTYTVVWILLAAVAIAAMLGPARRAVGVDPIAALREE